MLLSLILLSLIAWKVGVFTAIVRQKRKKILKKRINIREMVRI